MAYVHGSLSQTDSALSSGGPNPTGMGRNQGFNSLQTLNMPMTMSQPASINGVM